MSVIKSVKVVGKRTVVKVAKVGPQGATSPDAASVLEQALLRAGASVWTFDGTGTADADPGAGKLRANGASAPLWTQLFMSSTDVYGDGQGSLMDLWDDQYNGSYRAVVKIVEPSTGEWVVLKVTGPVANAGYRKVPVSMVAWSGVPFTTGERLGVSWSPVGDQAQSTTDAQAAMATVLAAKADFDPKYGDFSTKYAVFAPEYADFAVKYPDVVTKSADVTVKQAAAAGSESNARSYMLTAVAQAALAVAAAASASSTSLQDLSGATAAAIHRAPGAVVATCFMDTSKDSDPAWPARCDHLSYAAEALNGPWIPGTYASGIPNEVVARALGGTLGTELLPDATNAANWTPNGFSSVSSVNGRLRVTNTSGGNFAGASRPIATVAGQAYLITARRVADQTAAGQTTQGGVTAGTVAGGFTLLNGIITAANGNSGAFVFVATGATTYVGVQPNTNAAGNFCEFDSISCKQVTAWAPSGSYYQSATDGKFYRLFDNLVANSEALTAASWTANFATVTDSVETVSVGGVSVALSKVVPTTLNSGHTVMASTAMVASVVAFPVTAFCLAKADGYGQIRIGANANGAHGVVDLATGVLTASSGTITGGRVDLGGGLYLVYANWTQSGNLQLFAGVATGGLTSFAGDGVSGVRIGGLHVRTGTITPTIANYEKKTTDGSQTETFRGNSQRPPRFGLPVAEGSRVVVYDLTRPGYPMWMVFTGGGTVGSGNSWINYGTAGPAVTSIAYREGVLAIGGTSMGALLVDFARDDVKVVRNANWGLSKRRIADRNSAVTTISPVDGYTIPSTVQVNGISLCTMLDAPVDPVTGLQVPTIALACGSGLSIIKQDGSVVSSSATTALQQVQMNPYIALAWANGTVLSYVLKPGSLGTSFALSTITGNSAAGFSSSFNWTGLVTAGRSMLGRRSSGGTARFEMFRFNEASPLAGLLALITDTFSTGWMQGGTVRCLLADTAAAAAAPAVVATDDFSTGVAAWGAYLGAVNTDAGGKMRVTVNVGGQSSRAARGFPTTPGARYVVTADAVGMFANGGTAQAVSMNASNNADATAAFAVGSTVSVPTNGLSLEFTATQATTYFGLTGGGNGTAGSYVEWDNFKLTEVAPDRSYRGKTALIYGTGLSRAAVAIGAQLMAWTGFSNTSYIQEAYNADLDFGTTGFSVSAWFSLPTTMPTSSTNFPDLSAELITNGDFSAGSTGWTPGADWTFAGGVATHTAGAGSSQLAQGAGAAGKFYRITATVSGYAGGTIFALGGTNTVALGAANGTFTAIVKANTTAVGLTASNNFVGSVDNVSAKEVGPAYAVDRSSVAAGPYWRMGCWPDGSLVAEVNDNAGGSRIATTTGVYLGTRAKMRMQYDSSGTLTIKVAGRPMAQATGNPLATLNNAAAVFTVGNNSALTAAWPGDLCMVKATGTIPTDDAALWMHDQEVKMFAAGAQITLPDAGAVVDIGYDDMLASWYVASAANESRFSGLVRVSFAPAAAGSISKISGAQGCKAVARTTTNPGLDFTEPGKILREEMQRRTEEARRNAGITVPLDWSATFTENIAFGSTSNSSAVTGLVFPLGATVVGAQVSMASIPAGTVIANYANGNTYFSAAATATVNPATFTLLDYILPQGMEVADDVFANRQLQREGATFDYTRVFDGFRERVRFPSGAGPTGHVRINARRALQQ